MSYEGPVCYIDGWHYAVTEDEDGIQTPTDKLFCEDDGTMRLATDEDASWHDRKHGDFVVIQMEDAQPGLTVTPEELAKIKEMLGR